MTVQKSFKRLVRARMAKTGESYTGARAQLLAGVDEASADEAMPQLACSDERIHERTGKGWEEWFDLLDSWGAEEMRHTEIATRVAELRGIHVLGWDAQAVTTSFERAVSSPEKSPWISAMSMTAVPLNRPGFAISITLLVIVASTLPSITRTSQLLISTPLRLMLGPIDSLLPGV